MRQFFAQLKTIILRGGYRDAIQRRALHPRLFFEPRWFQLINSILRSRLFGRFRTSKLVSYGTCAAATVYCLSGSKINGMYSFFPTYWGSAGEHLSNMALIFSKIDVRKSYSQQSSGTTTLEFAGKSGLFEVCLHQTRSRFSADLPRKASVSTRDTSSVGHHCTSQPFTDTLYAYLQKFIIDI